MSGWPTSFVIDHKVEIQSKDPLPAFAPGGQLMLYAYDELDNPTLLTLKVVQIIYDINTIKQYVHLTLPSDSPYKNARFKIPGA